MAIVLSACAPTVTTRTENKTLPTAFNNSNDTTNIAKIRWRDFFDDPYLNALIDTALKNNQELNITLQEIEIARNEVRARKGEYLPFIDVGGGAGVEKVGRYTHQGVTDATTEYAPGKEMPEPLQDYLLGAFVSWEVDIWHKLRNAKKSAMLRYLSSVEGKNFMVTRLVAEIANSYYELLAFDNQLEILQRNIQIQQNALGIVRLQKMATRVTELAVRKFEAEVLKNQSKLFYAQQRIYETENKINFLIGRYPQSIARDPKNFNKSFPGILQAGIPSQLLENRPDIRQAELELEASKLDVKVAKANFYPGLGISAGLGLRAFDPRHLVRTPESIFYSIAGDLTAPLINRNAIKAAYNGANVKQIQAVFEYEQTVLKAFIEVANQLSNINNLQKSYDLKDLEVEALTESISISNNLFRSARAEYMEVLLTQRDALESKFELVETRKQQLNAKVNIYQALGGGWN
jgi:NodT family efflux transporter outer membrane factor (OMF) lipoprotein